METSTKCCFCDKTETSIGRVNDTKNFFALLSYKPVFPGHLMIIPKEHLTKFEQVKVDHAQELMSFIQQTIIAIKKCYQTDSYDLMIQVAI